MSAVRTYRDLWRQRVAELLGQRGAQGLWRWTTADDLFGGDS